MEKEVLELIKKNHLISNGEKVVIGVSGGPDSMCLLNVLHNLNINIVVAHVNHMLREEANEETKYVEDFCKNRDIKCYIKYVDINKLAEESKTGTEEIGRNERYKFFNEVMRKEGASKIATAHNLNDNAETVLMNIIRGTGINGLKGIDICRDEVVIRPLIKTSREDIEMYCKENNINPKFDKSNKESIYTRNKIRNDLIPFIKLNFNPNIINSLNRLSELAMEDSKYFERIVQKEYDNILIIEDENIELDLKKFNNLEYVIKTRILLYTINKVLGNTNGIEKKHIEDLIKLCSNNIGNKYLTPNKRIKVFVHNKRIIFSKLD